MTLVNAQAMWATMMATLGLLTASVGRLIAQVSATETGGAAWLSAGGTTSAVLALVYIARLFANGSLVARSPKESEDRLALIVEHSEQNQEQLMALVKSGHDREDLLVTLLREQHEATSQAAAAAVKAAQTAAEAAAAAAVVAATAASTAAQAAAHVT